MTELSEARKALADAQRKHREAADAAQAEHEHHQKIVTIRDRQRDLEWQLADAQAQHSRQLVEWAAAGAPGDAPAAPAAIEALAKKLGAAQREAAAAEDAAKQHEPKLKAAQEASAAALQRMRERRRDVLLECAQPYIDELHKARLRAEALYQHLAGLSAAARDSRELEIEVPALGRVTAPILDALKFNAVLVPGGAQQSRDTWRKLIDELASDPAATLGEAPLTIDGNAPRSPRMKVA